MNHTSRGSAAHMQTQPSTARHDCDWDGIFFIGNFHLEIELSVRQTSSGEQESRSLQDSGSRVQSNMRYGNHAL